MKTPNKQVSKQPTAKSKTTEKKTTKEKQDIDSTTEGFDSTTADPTKRDSETSHTKKHKIGFTTDEEEETATKSNKNDPTKPDSETSHKKKHKIDFTTKKTIR